MTKESGLKKDRWPWQPLHDQKSAQRRDRNTFPKVCIITPSYNQGEFLEETIRSVLQQDYPNIEYRVMDGGSSDQSIDIIKKYDEYLDGWVSGPDNGQADAVRKGWMNSDADILAYLNSDDTYLPGAVSSAVTAFQNHPEAAAVYGGELLIDRQGYLIRNRSGGKGVTHSDFLFLSFISQPATFISRKCYEESGGIDPSYNNIFDFELWVRLSQHGEFIPMTHVLATTRWYEDVKTIKNRMKVATELYRAIDSFLKKHDQDEDFNKKVRLNLHDRVIQILFENTSCYLAGIGTSLKTVRHVPGKSVYILSKLFSTGKAAAGAMISGTKKRPIVLPDTKLRGLHWSQWPVEKGNSKVIS